MQFFVDQAQNLAIILISVWFFLKVKEVPSHE